MNYTKTFITYQQYGELVYKLSDKLMEDKLKFDCIYGPPRGAWPIVTHLSHQLGIPVKDRLLFDVDDYINGEMFDDLYLVVDDIVDFGKTLIETENLLTKFKVKNVCYATLFYKKRSVFKPDYFVEEISDDLWIVFPWEKFDEEPNR